jgi:hemolysin activation/secretion protein
MDWLPALGWVAIISTLGTLTSLVLAWDRRETKKILQAQQETHARQVEILAQMKARQRQAPEETLPPTQAPPL